METRLVMVTMQRGGGGPSVYRLAHGRVLPDGRTIVKATLRESMARELGIQRGEAVR